MIKITDDFYIDADGKNYILRERSIIQDKESKNYGKELFKDEGYYTSLEHLLRGFLKIQTREWIQKNSGDIKDLLKEIENQNKFVESLKIEV